MKKLNRQTNKVTDYKVPQGWNVKVWGYDLNEKVNCVQCGKQLLLGMTYTSLEIFTDNLCFGYGVCKECYDKEWERRRKYED